MTGVFPFGRPGRAAPPSARAAKLFVLGAYPSALHIRWTPPKPYRSVRALPVDLEPEPFWNGADQAARVMAWKRAVGWRDEYGHADPAGRLNGSSGAWVDERILAPLGVRREDAWITDCLHWYCLSMGAAARIDDTYRPFAAEHDLPQVALPSHPSEGEIVTAAAVELPRLRAELLAVAPERAVTLGNAALRVMRQLVDAGLPRRLSAGGSYGRPAEGNSEGLGFTVLPLAHPAAPTVYQTAHERWMASI